MLQHQEQSQRSAILVVEDDAAIGAFLTELISQETPYQFVLVTDGWQALDVVQEVKPILFLLNYQLPGMHGLDLYDRLHAIKELAHVPAIIVSAVLPKRELEQRKLIGITKPFDMDRLLDAIEHVLANPQGKT
ncbi:MAG: response regulator [Ktedonobacteraceae bacterium]|jgi:CheY-like chemotaxis protein